MRTSTPSSGDRARKPVRRHTNPSEKDVASSYDSNDFPVLLRMPDLSVSETVGEGEMADKLEHSGMSAGEKGSAGKRKRRSGRVTPEASRESDDGIVTAALSAQYWSRLAPKIAVGGMLLSITTLCVVLLQGPSKPDAVDEGATQWASDTPPAASPLQDAEMGATDRTGPIGLSHDEAPPSHNGVIAVMPESPRRKPTTDSQNGVTFPVVAPGQEEKPETTGPELPDADSNMTLPQAGMDDPADAPPFCSVPAEGKPHRAERWPDDLEMSADQSGTDPELELNAALKAAQRQLPPMLRPRNGDIFIPNTPAQQPGAGGTRLNGTIEIPKPTADYRL